MPFPSHTLRAAAEGEPGAIAEFVDFSWPRIHRVVYLITGGAADAEDVAQDATLRAVGALERLNLDDPIEPWLNTVSVNAARDWLRKQSRRQELLVEQPSGAGADVSWSVGLDAAELSGEIVDALRALPDEQRAVIVMRHLLDMRATEVAEALGVPEGTVRSLDHRGLARLRRELVTEEVSDAR